LSFKYNTQEINAKCFDNYASVMTVGVQNKCELSACFGKFLLLIKTVQVVVYPMGKVMATKNPTAHLENY